MNSVLEGALASDRRISFGGLMRAMLGQLRAGGLPLLGTWLALIAVDYGLSAIRSRLPAPVTTFSLPHQSIALLSLVVAAVGGALALQVMLGGRLRLYRRFAACALLLLGGGVAMVAPAYVNMLIPIDSARQADMAYRGMAVTVLLPLVGITLIRFAMWPLGQLRGRAGATAAWSWSRTRGVTLSWILACLCVAVPYFAVSVGVTAVEVARGVTPQLWGRDPASRAVISTTWQLYGLALAAAVYRLRVEPELRVAEVFD